jgi:hypothetical protein
LHSALARLFGVLNELETQSSSLVRVFEEFDEAKRWLLAPR